MIFEVSSPGSDALLNLVVVLFCLCVAISALVFGRAVERVGGWFLTLSIGFHILFGVIFPNRISHENLINLALSFVDLVMFSTLALKTYRMWPIIASGSLFLICNVQVLAWYGVDIGLFGDGRILTALWTSVPLLLLASLIRSMLRQRFERVQQIRRKKR